ncbi:MAG: cytochrome c [Verrucomicrobia bacterium]|nr:cytochrome c [Verrucomicrobiota bacterium]
MRYFFLIYAIIAVLVVGIFGFRGQQFAKPPLRIFPDMDEQDVLRAQKPDAFFANGQGGRLPVPQTQPRGFNEDGLRELGGIPEYEFSGDTGYYYTGQIGDYFGNGMPEELALTADHATALIRRGQAVFTINCALCHGPSGDGQGITSTYGVPVAANPNAKLNSISPTIYPDGRIFNTITQGKGLMSAYGPNIPVRDRWAVIAYIHTLQAAKASQPKTR